MGKGPLLGAAEKLGFGAGGAANWKVPSLSRPSTATWPRSTVPRARPPGHWSKGAPERNSSTMCEPGNWPEDGPEPLLRHPLAALKPEADCQ